MSVRIRFFAQFRELLGNDIMVAPKKGATIGKVIREVATRNGEGFNAVFAADGSFHDFVILMKNGKRIETNEAERTTVSDGDEIAVFPPVAGG